MTIARMTGITQAIGNFAQNGCAGGTVVGGGLVSTGGMVVGVVVTVPFVVVFTFPPFVVPEPVLGDTVVEVVVGTVVGLVVVVTT